MGKTYTPTYRLEMTIPGMARTSQAWESKQDGRPTVANLAKYIDAWIVSTYIGQCNEHISRDLGFIPVPTRARIVHQATGRVVADWTAPAFMIMPPTPEPRAESLAEEWARRTRTQTAA